MKKYRIGYTQGVYDMFHIGHLNLINHAKEYCEYLIVGVNGDSLVESYKDKTPVINQKDRRTIVANIKAVDECIVVTTLDKVEIWNNLQFDAIFIGDDWKGDSRWKKTEKDLHILGAEVVYLPHTNGISSTLLKPQKNGAIKEG